MNQELNGYIVFYHTHRQKKHDCSDKKKILLEISIPLRVMVFGSSKNLAWLNLLKTKGFWGAKKQRLSH
jgi:hypothetical protein